MTQSNAEFLFQISLLVDRLGVAKAGRQSYMMTSDEAAKYHDLLAPIAGKAKRIHYRDGLRGWCGTHVSSTRHLTLHRGTVNCLRCLNLMDMKATDA
jgi:hypothetical protein